MKLNWITLRVSDLEKSTAFYRDMLGMEIVSRFGGEGHEIVMLGAADGPKVELIQDKTIDLTEPGKGISFGLESSQLDHLISKLQTAGFSLIGPIQPNPHIRFFFVKDPDGYTIQLL